MSRRVKDWIGKSIMWLCSVYVMALVLITLWGQ